jgi:beta-glucanase (GH16 family)
MRTAHYVPVKITALAIILAGCASNGEKAATSDHVLLTSSTPKAHVIDYGPVQRSEAWQLVWRDEFDGDEIDKNKWRHEENCWGGGNNEKQCYTDRKVNSFVKDGVLHIVAKEGNFTGPATPDGSSRVKATLPYTSARLNTKDKGDWKYGRFEIRAKLPSGQGTWPAIWMMPTDAVYGTWAASGEIDILEAVNLKTLSSETGAAEGELESRVFGSLHFGQTWPGNAHIGQATHLPGNANPADDFHTYAIEWEEGEIRWYVDDHHFATQTADGWWSQYKKNGMLVNAPHNAPFDERFHLLLNLAVGGNWSANANHGGIDSSVFPQTLLVDYVRVYQCSKDLETGKGCAAVSPQAKMVEGQKPPKILKSDPDFGKGPLFTLFDDELNSGLAYDGYDPDHYIKYEVVDEEGRGKVIAMSKSGGTGNMYFRSVPTNLSHWADDGQLVFDLNVESRDAGTELLVKMDSGWPNTSDYSVPITAEGQWQEVRIDVSELISNGNRFAPGKASLNKITNVMIIEPLGKMKLKIDNIRFEYAKK